MIGVGITLWLDRGQGEVSLPVAAEPLLIRGQPVSLSEPVSLGKGITTITGGSGAQTLAGRISRAGPRFFTSAVQVLPRTSLVVRGYSLSRLTGVVAGKLQGLGIGSAALPAQGYHFRTVGEHKEVQLQAVQDGLVKTVKVRFAQSPDGVEAGVVYAKDADVSMLGADFDVIEANEQPANSNFREPGYGCVDLQLDGIPGTATLKYSLDPGAVLTVSGDNDYAGSTGIASGTVRAGHANAFGTSVVVVLPNGTLDKAGLVLPNEIMARGGVVLE